MKKFKWFFIGIFIIFFLFLIKYFFFPSQSNSSNLNNNNKKQIFNVDYFIAKNFKLDDQIFTTGIIGSFNQIEIKTEVSGKIVKIYFKEGEFVQKDKPIIKLKDDDLQAILLKSKLQLKLEEEKLERMKKLLDIQGVSQDEYEDQELKVKNIKADIQYNEALVNKTIIYAPFSGKIGLKNISEGAFVTPANVIANLIQVEPIFIEFSFPEKYGSLINTETIIEFNNDNKYDTAKNIAKIYAIDPLLDENTKTIKARAIYEGKKKFFIGGFVNVLININSNNNVLMIPTQCLIPIMKGNKVYLAKNNTVNEILVKIGVRNEAKVQILSGLNIGDTILTNGIMFVKQGSLINLINEEF